jgi:hypothetical protein
MDRRYNTGYQYQESRQDNEQTIAVACGGFEHQMIMKSMGVNIVENLDFERAVEAARRLNRYEFMITFAPLPVEGGTGSSVNPLAIF